MLSTAFHHQGKGYAKKALLELPNFLKTNFNGIDEIVLAALTIKIKLRKDCINTADLLKVVNVKWEERAKSSL
jgi:allophanate hydrolase subunit 1